MSLKFGLNSARWVNGFEFSSIKGRLGTFRTKARATRRPWLNKAMILSENKGCSVLNVLRQIIKHFLTRNLNQLFPPFNKPI
jgi:hypothetical protein